MRYEEKRIYQFLKDGQYKVDILLDSMDLDQVVLRRNDYGVAIIRILSQHKALETAQYLETLGIVCLNSSKAIKICSDKAMQALLLIGNQSVQQPAFSIIRKYADIKKEYQRFKDAIVVKPINSSWGRGISLLNSSNTLSVWLEAHEDLDIQGERLPFLVQEYIDKPNYDLRIIIIDNKPVVGFKRISESNWKTNTHLGQSLKQLCLLIRLKIFAARWLDY